MLTAAITQMSKPFFKELSGLKCSISFLIYYNFRYTPNAFGFGGSSAGNINSYDSIDPSSFVVDSTTPSSGTTYEPRSSPTELPDSGGMIMSPSAPPNATIPPDSVQISELLARTITDAHNRTCLYTNGKSTFA